MKKSNPTPSELSRNLYLEDMCNKYGPFAVYVYCKLSADMMRYTATSEDDHITIQCFETLAALYKSKIEPFHVMLSNIITKNLH